MADYRAYVVGADGHFVNGRAFVCDNDSNATEWAKQLFDADKEVELWCGARLVTRLGLRGQQRGDAVSHEILAGLMVPKNKAASVVVGDGPRGKWKLKEAA